MSQEFLDVTQLNNLFGKEQVQETFGDGVPQETFTADQPEPTPDDLFVPDVITPDDVIVPDTSRDNIFQSRPSLNEVVTSLIKSGDWEDVSLKIEDKEYNSLEELMKDKHVDIELFNELLDSQKELKKEKINSSYLKMDDPNGINANLAKAILQGQDYGELLSEKENTIDPIAQLDFSFIPNDAADMQRAENDAANLLLWHHEANLGYNLQDGYVRNAVLEKIKQLKENFELLDVAESVKTSVIANYNDDLKNRFQAEEALKNQQQQDKKQDIKKFKDTLKSKGYTDNFVRDATALKYEIDNTSSNPQYISIIKNRMETDPEFATEMLHFLLDKEGYLNAQKLPEKLETQRRMIEISGKAKKSSTQQDQGTGGKTRTAEEEKIFRLFGG